MPSVQALKKDFPNIPWPDDLTSSAKIDYSPEFLKKVGEEAKALKKRDSLLNFHETFLVILHKRLTVEFKPTIVTKKTKLKPPKKNALVEVECSNPECDNTSGIWLVKGETPFTEKLKLCCTECGKELSDFVEVVKKAEKPKVEKAPKAPKAPTKKQEAVYQEMLKTMTDFAVGIECFPEDQQEVFWAVQAWKDINPPSEK